MDGFSSTGRSDDQGMSNVADVEIEPKRRCPLGSCIHKSRPIQLLVALGTCPDVRYGHHMDEIARRYVRAPAIMRKVSGDAAQPCIHGTNVFNLWTHVPVLEYIEDALGFRADKVVILVHDNHHGRIISIADLVRFHGTNRRLCFIEFIHGVVVDVLRRYGLLVKEHAADHDLERLHLASPTRFPAVQPTERVLLVLAEEARHPTVGKSFAIEIVEHAEQAVARISFRDNDLHILFPQLWIVAAKQRVVV